MDKENRKKYLFATFVIALFVVNEAQEQTRQTVFYDDMRTHHYSVESVYSTLSEALLRDRVTDQQKVEMAYHLCERISHIEDELRINKPDESCLEIYKKVTSQELTEQ